MEFKKIELSDKKVFDEYYKKHPQDMCFFAFSILYLWRNYINISYGFHDGELIITGRSYGEETDFSLPQTTKESFKAACDYLMSVCGGKLKILSLTKQQKNFMKELYPNKFIFEKKRDDANYIYETESLITLAGKKLHSKRNHINKFNSLYNWEYVQINSSNKQECIDVAREWYVNKGGGDDEMRYELNTCKEALDNLEALSLKCGAIKVDGKIAAFSIGELLNPDMAHILIEKADVSYEGIYSVINNEFLKREFSSAKYVNREEDVGIEGLRKSKLSYRPAYLIDIYDAELK